jgi:hypothetical protein
MKEKDAYDRLPKETRAVVEEHGKAMGMSPREIHDEYLNAQAILHPAKLRHRNLFKRHRKGPNGYER